MNKTVKIAVKNNGYGYKNISVNGIEVFNSFPASNGGESVEVSVPIGTEGYINLSGGRKHPHKYKLGEVCTFPIEVSRVWKLWKEKE